jgi:hypothetical protein
MIDKADFDYQNLKDSINFNKANPSDTINSQNFHIDNSSDFLDPQGFLIDDPSAILELAHNIANAIGQFC